MESGRVKGQVGLIRLRHAYADLLASSKKGLGRGMSKEHIELFKAHDKARHARLLADVVQFPVGGTWDPFLAGCGYSQSGDLLTSQHALDGIMGFGQSQLSVISQLNSQGLTPGIFAHCLEGSDKGGGILVLGNVVEPGMVFTPIIPSQAHYNVNLKEISVNGIALAVDSSAYNTNKVQGTIFDSGTTLTYLIEPAYIAFIDAIIKGVPKEAQHVSHQSTPCFIYSGSVDDAFPVVTFHFEGANMNLKGSHYLIQQADIVATPVWCIGWQPISATTAVNGVQLTILGGLGLKYTRFFLLAVVGIYFC